MLTLSTQLQKRSFYVIERTRTSSKCQKMKNARAKRAKILFFIVKYANLWSLCCPHSRGCLAPREELIVFAYLILKPQFLSVVQFPFDNCHSPFFPTTFFEIGVYVIKVWRSSAKRMMSSMYITKSTPPSLSLAKAGLRSLVKS